MKSPIRAGTLASTFAVLIVICVIIRHSEYLRDRLDHIDEVKDGITGSWRGHLGIGDWKPSIDPKYLGFGTPSPIPTRNRTLPFSSPTPEPTYQQESDETAKPGEESAAEETTSDVKEKQPPASGPDSESEEPVAVEKEELKTDAENSAEDQLIRTGPDKIVVMGKTAEEDTAWVSEHLKDWDHAIYSVDDKNATLHTPMNKGKEAMAYLTYLIDNYGKYPSTVAFIHSHQDRFWHGAGMPARSNMVALKALKIDFVQRQGFVNLRCSLGPGCPAEVQPYREETPANRMYERTMLTVWEIFFGEKCPQVIAAPCCAQFAVSRDQIMMRPLEDYVMYRQWLVETELDDDNSGRVFEYLWHVIFGRNPVHCPDYGDCWADVYGNPTMADLNRLFYGGSS